MKPLADRLCLQRTLRRFLDDASPTVRKPFWDAADQHLYPGTASKHLTSSGRHWNRLIRLTRRIST